MEKWHIETDFNTHRAIFTVCATSLAQAIRMVSDTYGVAAGAIKSARLVSSFHEKQGIIC